MGPAEFGQIAAGGDAEPGGKGLEQHRHQVGEDNDPEQVVAIGRAALDVGGEVAGVHIGDRGDEGRPEERQDGPETTPLAGAVRQADIARLGIQ